MSNRNHSIGIGLQLSLISALFIFLTFYLGDYIREYAGQDIYVKVQMVAVALTVIFAAIGIIIAVKFYRTKANSRAKLKKGESYRIKTSDKAEHHGSAGWATAATLNKSGLDLKEKRWKEPRLYLGEHEGLSLSCSRENRVLTQGKTGAGKTVLLVQQVQKWLAHGGDIVVSDVKPELFGMLRPTLSKLGVKTICLAPFQAVGQRYGFFSEIGNEPGEKESYLEIISSGLMPDSEKNEGYFIDIARTIIYCLLSYTHKIGAPLGEALNILQTIESQCPKKKKISKWFVEVIEKSGDDSVRKKASLLNKVADSDRAWGSVQGDVLRGLEWLSNPIARDFVSDTSLSLRREFTSGAQNAIFLMHPDKDWDSKRKTPGVKDRLFSTLCGQIMNVIKLCGRSRPRPCLVALDELGNFPPVPQLETFLNVTRDRRVAAILSTQYSAQLDDRYGRSLKSACTTILTYALTDEDSARWVSERLGKAGLTTRETHTGGLIGRSRSEVERITSRPLLEPHEITDLEKGELVLWHGGIRSVGSAKQWWKDRKSKGWIQAADDDNCMPARRS